MNRQDFSASVQIASLVVVIVIVVIIIIIIVRFTFSGYCRSWSWLYSIVMTMMRETIVLMTIVLLLLSSSSLSLSLLLLLSQSSIRSKGNVSPIFILFFMFFFLFQFSIFIPVTFYLLSNLPKSRLFQTSPSQRPRLRFFFSLNCNAMPVWSFWKEQKRKTLWRIGRELQKECQVCLAKLLSSTYTVSTRIFMKKMYNKWEILKIRIQIEVKKRIQVRVKKKDSFTFSWVG